MRHLSPEEIAAIALGEPGAEASAHLAACGECRGEVEALRRTAVRMRAGAVAPAAPSAGLWERIAAEVEEGSAPRAARGSVSAAAGGPSTDAASHDASTPSAESEQPAASATGSGHVAPRRRRSRRFGVATLVTACLASAAIAAGAVWLSVGQLGSGAQGSSLAAVQLDPLQPIVDPAQARIVERDGHRVLLLEADRLPEVDGYLDVWLIDSDVQGMVSVGLFDASTTEIVLPDGLDLAGYPIVDVSVEPFDGDPTHSGESVWRGVLEL
ncbi:anti-sigma factor [Agrococcus sp. 1P02AA]|uniref:anti-sigma factor n=1 Tax=Agrococcus sp. 1P02AA TaxID=3132259 RepID=UPI0039A47E2E